MRQSLAEPTIVMDFETTGLSPDWGDRTIEVGAVLIEQGRIVDRFQSLMNPGVRISSFIEQYTGITNRMIERAPPVAEVMQALAGFIGDTPLVAHNASFDRKFLDAELARIAEVRRQPVACSMLIARRVYPEAPNHKLGTLVAYTRIPNDGVFHRALADAELTARLWLKMQDELARQYQLESLSFAIMQGLQRVSRQAVAGYFQRLAAG